DLPAGLAQTLTEASMHLAGHDEPIEPPLLLETSVLAPDPELSRLASLDFRLTTRRRGIGGLVLRGSDDTGLLAIELRVDTETRELTTGFAFEPCNVLPEKGEQVGAWTDMLSPPNLLELNFASSADGR